MGQRTLIQPPALQGAVTNDRTSFVSPTSLTKQNSLRTGRQFYLEGPVGLEPTTPCLKGRCSNRLSYGPKLEINSLHYRYLQRKVNPLTGESLAAEMLMHELQQVVDQ